MKHELTLTLRPSLYTRTPAQQYELVTPLLRVALKGYKYTMIAELTSNELNVHYHAIIEINGLQQKNVLLNKLRPLNKYLGRKTCQAVQFETSYNNYLKKDLTKTQKVIVDPVVNDDYKLFQKDLFGPYFETKQRTKENSNVERSTTHLELSHKPPLDARGSRASEPSLDPLDYGIDLTEQRI